MPFLSAKRLIAALVLAVSAAGFSPLPCPADGVRLRTVVIDAGHGGHDAGAVSQDGKVKEKNIALDVTLRLGAKIKESYPGVKVIYTRDKDFFVPLDKRADIANKNHADLFISIHCNSVDNKAPNGSETFVMGMDRNNANMEVCKRENSVILLEEDYATKYQGFDPNDTESYIFFNLMQNAYFEQSLIFAEMCQKQMRKGPVKHDRGIKQAGFVVLWQTTMPSVLVELGFLSNAQDREVLTDKSKRDLIAGNLLKAFSEFKKQYEGGTVISPDDKPAQEDKSKTGGDTASAPADGQADVDEGGNFYAVQLFVLSKELKEGAPQFKGAGPVHRFKVGTVYKYTAGEFKNEQEAVQEAIRLKKDFPGCFVVKIDNFEIKKK